MNWDQVQGKWKQVKGAVKQLWGKLTNDDLDIIDGQKDKLVGKLQERYGVTAKSPPAEFGTGLPVPTRKTSLRQ
jgi:uncharacterized protein YjbJ (UPF0337 family)